MILIVDPELLDREFQMLLLTNQNEIHCSECKEYDEVDFLVNTREYGEVVIPKNCIKEIKEG